MKKALIISSIFIVLSLMFFSIARAASVSGNVGFGGKIIAVEAVKITTLQAAGFMCEMAGITFDIKPVGKSKSGPYLAPFGKNTPNVGRWILGLRTPTMGPIATCIHPEGATEIVQGYTVTRYATSKI